MLIAIEGADGVGKATQTKLLAERFITEGEHAVVFSFPRYDTPLGAVIKRLLTGTTSFKGPAQDDAMFLQAAMTADKYAAWTDIGRYLGRGHHVVCDRWTSSAIAYGAADGLDQAWLAQIQQTLPAADVNVLLVISEEDALSRRPELRDRYEQDRAKQAAVRQMYAGLWGARQAIDRRRKWVTVDGSGSPDAVHERIWAQVTA